MGDTCVGKRIKELRKERRYTRECLAENAGISTKFLYEIESGKKNFSTETLKKIAKALEVSCDYIMFGNSVSNK